MKLSEIFELVNEKYEMSVRLVRKYDDGFRNDVFKVKDINSGKFFVLIIYKKEKGIEKVIENAHTVAQFLRAKNFPARVPLKSNSGNFYQKIMPGRFIALYPFLGGDTIPWEAYKRRHLKSIGKNLSNIHFELQDFNKKLPKWEKEIGIEINFMNKYFKKVEPWIERKLNLKLNNQKISQALILPDLKKEKRLTLHYDFVRGNILFSNKILNDDTYEITGIIDFEKVCKGPVLGNIARTLSFLIVDCKYKNEDEIKKWFLLRGYIKRGKFEIKISEKLLEKLLQIFWLRDFYKFLLHNPYESLHENEHYLRTIDKLLERKLLTKLKEKV